MPNENIELKSGQEFRTYNLELRANQNEEHGHFIEGRPIVFGQRTNMGWYDEIISVGALNETDLKDVRFLVNHNTDMIPLARSRNNNEKSTMQMIIAPEGMDIRADLDVENNSEAHNLYSAVKRGDVSGMSFMFNVNSDKWDDIESDHPTRTILGINKVYEVSAVTWPAYEGTSITTRCAGALDNAKAELDSLRAEIENKKNAEEAREKALIEAETRERELFLLENK